MILWKCLKPDCMRKVERGIQYCCAPCRLAAAGNYEIDRHSDGCDDRMDERGECNEYEAVALRQTSGPLQPEVEEPR